MYRLRREDAEPEVFYVVDADGRDVGELAWTSAGELNASWFNGEKWMRLGEYAARWDRNRDAAVVATVRDVLRQGDPWMRGGRWDSAGVVAETTNEDRAAWAGEALETSCLVTRHSLDNRDLQDCMAELLGNLMHLARMEGDAGVFDEALDAGRRSFAEEIAQEPALGEEVHGGDRLQAAIERINVPDRRLYGFGSKSSCEPTMPGVDPPAG